MKKIIDGAEQKILQDCNELLNLPQLREKV